MTCTRERGEGPRGARGPLFTSHFGAWCVLCGVQSTPRGATAEVHSRTGGVADGLAACSVCPAGGGCCLYKASLSSWWFGAPMAACCSYNRAELATQLLATARLVAVRHLNANV